MILISIVVCEIAFWLVLFAGLVAKYAVRRPRLGTALLVLTPVIDVVLLVLVLADLLGGGTASWQHGVAAIYIGVSVAYGRRMIMWADARFAYRFTGGPKPERLTGVAYSLKCWRDVGLTLLMAAIAAALLGALIVIGGDPERTAALAGFFNLLGVIVVIEVVWAVSYTIWPKKPRVGADRADSRIPPRLNLH